MFLLIAALERSAIQETTTTTTTTTKSTHNHNFLHLYVFLVRNLSRILSTSLGVYLPKIFFNFTVYHYFGVIGDRYFMFTIPLGGGGRVAWGQIEKWTLIDQLSSSRTNKSIFLSLRLKIKKSLKM